jgi:hypothetical protein
MKILMANIPKKNPFMLSKHNSCVSCKTKCEKVAMAMARCENLDYLCRKLFKNYFTNQNTNNTNLKT